jgi:hypothetical protein
MILSESRLEVLINLRNKLCVINNANNADKELDKKRVVLAEDY